MSFKKSLQIFVPICCLLIGGCSGKPEAAESPAKASTDAGSGRKAQNACELITASEATEIIGSPVVAKETRSGCLYKAEGQEFLLKVQWTEGKSAWEAQQQAMALGGKLLGADRDNTAAGVMRAEEAQLGDKSSYNPILGGYVLKGDVLLEFNNLVTLRDPRAKWEKLARKSALPIVKGQEMRRVLQRFRRHLIGLAAIVLIGFSPFIPVVIAGVVASVNGCQLDEGSTHPCVILGLDFGGALYMMGVMGWFGLATLPAAAFLLLVWTAWIVVSLLSPLRPVKR